MLTEIKGRSNFNDFLIKSKRTIFFPSASIIKMVPICMAELITINPMIKIVAKMTERIIRGNGRLIRLGRVSCEIGEVSPIVTSRIIPRIDQRARTAKPTKVKIKRLESDFSKVCQESVKRVIKETILCRLEVEVFFFPTLFRLE